MSTQAVVTKNRPSIVGTSVLAAVTIAGVVGFAVLRFFNAFAGAGVTMEIPVPHGAATMDADSEASIQVTRALVTVTNGGAGLIVLVCGTILLAAIAGIAVVVCYLLLTIDVVRSRGFSRRSIRMLTTMSTIIFIATAGCYLLDSAIARAIRDAAGLGEVGAITSLSYWMSFAIVGALGTFAYAFRRGAALQKDTEGLV